jgi:hypothetical protein
MNTTSNSYFKTLLIIVAWLICIIIIYESRNYYSLFSDLANRVFIIIASIITLIVFFRDNKNYKQVQQLAAFSATITAGICIAVLLLLVWLLKQRDNTPTKLHAGAGKLISTSIDLRENKTFKITINQLFSAEYFRGPYVVKDSLVILDSVSALEALDAHRYVIRTFPYNDSIENPKHKGLLASLFKNQIPDTTAKVYLVPIDAQGAVIKNARQFYVR